MLSTLCPVRKLVKFPEDSVYTKFNPPNPLLR
jgi:hypothetical protein